MTDPIYLRIEIVVGSNIFCLLYMFSNSFFPWSREYKKRPCKELSKAVNAFPNTPFWDRPKFKEAADNKWNVAIKGLLDTDCKENIAEKGEIAHYEQFHLFSQCFPKAFFFNVLK